MSFFFFGILVSRDNGGSLKTWKVQIVRKMKRDVKIQVLKYFLNLFNGIFFIIGAVILACGIWILWDENSFITTLFPTEDQDNILSISAYCFLAIGITVIIVSLVGCMGSIKEVKCLFNLYFFFLILIFILQLAIGLAVVFQYSKIVTAIDEKTIEVIKQYGNDSFSKECRWNLLDAIQKEGCSTEIKQWLSNNILTLLGAAVVLLIIQVLQFIMAMYLLKYIKKKSMI
ncbi:CD82 antigen-like isoform X3 [Heterodontus francisci]|uniref:CD82 antigen-like isoform X3 n=1 Tax=Heterodontus francisci TaxID=7792 RepID=UPI00355BE329